MPTILMTILTGISLSISGGVMQSITHNDLVSPFTLGISAAAAFGASLCIVFGGSILHSTGGLILGAFTASCLCISLVYGLSFKTGSTASTFISRSGFCPADLYGYKLYRCHRICRTDCTSYCKNTCRKWAPYLPPHDCGHRILPTALRGRPWKIYLISRFDPGWHYHFLYRCPYFCTPDPFHEKKGDIDALNRKSCRLFLWQLAYDSEKYNLSVGQKKLRRHTGPEWNR